MHKDTIGRTLGVAVAVCVACSIVVSSAAVFLKPLQEANQLRDMKRNILAAAGFSDEQLNVSTEEFDKLYDEMIDTEVVELATGEFLTGVEPEDIDDRKEAKNRELSMAIPDEQDLAKIKRRANRRKIHLYREDGKIKRIILPVYGKGLWSTMYGYLALAGDGRTIKSLAFYEHGETPGLGGEIDNPRWKAVWIGKTAYDEKGKPRIEVIKGTVAADSPRAQYQVDGISGATITGRGVEKLVRFWLDEQGYGPALDKLRAKEAAQ
ncbi:MAG: Na(+)-translocating NADH-quinone reductase subunit C [Pirellulales bacterium]|nr:Na(+)-translocating NADH-quinone reductase subunit C [Pirellulales bacterium]